MWDATCTDTFAPSILFALVSNPGSACIAAEVRKRIGYANLTQDNIFVPVVVETSGLIGQDASSILHRIGRKISRDRGDSDRFFLFQRLSLAIVMGNAFSIVTSA